MSLSPNVIELLRALADGKQIQWRADGPEEWADCDADTALSYIAAGHTPALRVKPEFVRFECKVPRPLGSAPPKGTAYFIPDLGRESFVSRQVWAGSEADRRVLERGLVHLASADAHQHANVLLTGTALPRRFVDEPSRSEY